MAKASSTALNESQYNFVVFEEFAGALCYIYAARVRAILLMQISYIHNDNNNNNANNRFIQPIIIRENINIKAVLLNEH